MDGTDFLLLSMILLGIVAGGLFQVNTYSGSVLQSPPSLQNAEVEWNRADWTTAVQGFQNNFDEQAYCLFGTVSEDKVVIEDMREATTFSSGRKYVAFTCRLRYVTKLPQVLVRPDYDLIGTIHTHPDSHIPRLSEFDKKQFGQLAIQGVASNSEVRFYSQGSTDEQLPVTYTDE